jgi:hypothetical protein
MPTVGTGIGRRRRPGASAPAGPVSDPAITSARADSWSVAYTAPPPMDPAGSPRYLALSRAGYSSAGVAASHVEPLILTKRVRQPYPAQASLDASRVALSDYVYATDTILGGAANAAVEVSPKPIANWALPDHRVVGNSLRLELVAAHRNARSRSQVACVEFRATDGTATVTQIVSAPSVLGHPGDLNAVVGYACDLDITSLSAGPVTANARVCPWIGGTASVLNSVDQSALREFRPQIFLKNVTLAASPVFIYVNATTGNDTSGAVSTNAATAEASPCATAAGAINRAVAVNGIMDGVEIRFMAGTHVLTTSGIIVTTRPQTTGECTFTRDPNATRAGVVLQFGTTAMRPRLGAAGGWLRISGVTLDRTGTSTFSGEASSRLRVIVEDFAFANNSQNATIFSNSDVGWIGGSFTGLTGNSILGPTSAGEHLLMRGVSGDLNGGALQLWATLGCNLVRPAQINSGTRSASGAIFVFNKIASPTSTTCIGLATASDVIGCAILQNVLEWTSTQTGHFVGISNDGQAGNSTHLVMHHNTIAGFWNSGRCNLLYDEGPTARTNKLHSFVGNIHVAINTKGDVFRGANEAGADAASRTGNWAYLYGVGCRGEFSQFTDANNGGLGTSFAQDYPGLDAHIGTSNSIRNNPLFMNDQATTSGPTAGSGGGDYSLQAGSPAIGRVKAPVLAFDLAGNARSATASAAGAYEWLTP